MDKAYFVSDVHLNSEEDPRWPQFLNFLLSLDNKKITHLFLVGDIFDLWIADHYCFKDKYRPFIAEIKRLQDSGVEVHYFEGNHDLYLKHFWSKVIGVQVHEEFGSFELNKKLIRVEHGDLIDPDDKGYLALRHILRTGFMKLFALYMPAFIVVKLGEFASRKSRHYTSEVKTIDKPLAIKKIRAHAERVSRDVPYNFIISGHMHVRDDFTIKEDHWKTRSINLGSWLSGKIKVFYIDKNKQKFIDIK